MKKIDAEQKAIIIGGIVLFLMFLVVVGTLYYQEYKFKNTGTPAEKQLERLDKADTTDHARYRALDAERLAEIRALKRELALSKSKDKQQTDKATQSANTYAKTPTLINCDKALTDCKEENETKSYSLAVQGKMLGQYELKALADSLEINRNRGVVDSLKAGWGDANKLAAKQDKKINSKNKLLKIGGGVIAALAVLVAVK